MIVTPAAKTNRPKPGKNKGDQRVKAIILRIRRLVRDQFDTYS